MKKLIVALSICLLLLLGVCVVLHLNEGGAALPAQTQPDKTYSVRFEMGGTVCSEQTVTEGQLPEAFSPQVPGLIFRAWTDRYGMEVDPFSQPVTADVRYAARYYPALAGGKAYLFADAENRLRPDDGLTAEELTQALTALAVEGAEDYFPKLPAGSEVLTGETVYAFLENFFDAETVADAFSHAEGETMSRSAFARGMNTLLGYDAAHTVILAPGSAIPVDVTAERSDAIALVQSAVAFTVSEESTMTWADIELPTSLAPGFVNLEGWLYYVREDHYFLRDGKVGTLYFGTDGRYTSGDALLDATVAQILAVLMEENPEADRMELLRIVYDHCHTQYKYLRRYDHPAFGATGWEIQRASAMFESGKGNCYSFAAIFWALSRGLGYETRAISGTCLSDEQPHSWCIIELEGEDYFFDPEWQYAYTERGVFDKDMFKIPMNKVSYWGYKWTEQKEAD